MGLKSSKRYLVLYRYVVRQFNTYDRLYWEDYCISKETLREFNVKPITHYWINGIAILHIKLHMPTVNILESTNYTLH
jgi:hypothetical protein